MTSAKSLAIAAAVALASLTFASEAIAGVSIYFGPGGGYYGGPYYGYGYGYYPHAYPYYSYGYYPRYRTDTDLIGEATGGGIGGAGISPRVHMASHLLQQKFGRRVRGVGLL